MTSFAEESLETGDRLPNLDLPVDDRWHDEDGTVSLRAGPRRAAFLLYLPHDGAGAAAEVDEEDAAWRPPCRPCRSFLEDLTGASDTIALKGGAIAIASPEGRQMLADRVGIPETGRHLIEAHLIVADRFGEVWNVYSFRATDEPSAAGAGDDANSGSGIHEDLPSIPELVEWVDYLGTQCPECGVLDTTDRGWRTI